MDKKSRSLHEIATDLDSRITRLEQFYFVMSGLYGVSLGDFDIKNEMVEISKEILSLFKELEITKGGTEELARLKIKYNLMAQIWEGAIRNGRPAEGNFNEKFRQIFRKYRR